MCNIEIKWEVSKWITNFYSNIRDKMQNPQNAVTDGQFPDQNWQKPGRVDFPRLIMKLANSYQMVDPVRSLD